MCLLCLCVIIATEGKEKRDFSVFVLLCSMWGFTMSDLIYLDYTDHLVRRSGSSIKYDIDRAVSIAVDWMSALGFITLPLSGFSRGFFTVKCVSCDFDGDEPSCILGSDIRIFVYRVGSEFVAVPDVWEDAGVEFTGTLGGVYTA